jgi:hypothetical protein
MTVKERLKRFIKYKNISERRFCTTVGLSPTYVSAMRTSIQPDKVLNIALHFPDLNTGWLMTGEGEMLKRQDSNKVESLEALKEPDINPHFEYRSIDALSRALDRLTQMYERAVLENEDLKEEVEELKKVVDAQRGTA